MAEQTGTVRRAAVLGDPVEHSLSPVLHSAGYEALGLEGWSYGRIQCPAGELERIVSGAGPEYRGFSVTMPGKPEALAYADRITDRALKVDSANTLLREDSPGCGSANWVADCTDIDGAAAAVALHGALPGGWKAVLFGAGGTSRPFIAALAEAGAAEIVIATRRPTAGPALACAERFGVPARDVRLDSPELTALVEGAALVVNTVPAPGAEALTPLVGGAARLVDALYDPWPTPLARAVLESGGTVVGGDEMLLGQALGQFEQFTGHAAPREAMRAALNDALARRSARGR
ncbi:shikimate dehydrogenase [Dietzia sp.]|uniref:shikimate dehydrogenase n=1 Tax=Dietzia sp. TaxID=1871616 RepID=UPI002FD975A9